MDRGGDQGGNDEDVDTFDDLIDPNAEAIRAVTKKRRAESRVTKARLRVQTRRATSEAALEKLLPAKIAEGDSWHVISGGDIDSLSYLAHLLRGRRADYVLVSTWCMAQQDVDCIARWIDSSTIARLDAYVGEIFPNQYPGAHEALCHQVRRVNGRVAVFRNHAKVMLMAESSSSNRYVIESSANINTNPRTEQTAVCNHSGLFEHYKDFFDGINSYNQNFQDWQPWQDPESPQN